MKQDLLAGDFIPFPLRSVLRPSIHLYLVDCAYTEVGEVKNHGFGSRPSPCNILKAERITCVNRTMRSGAYLSRF